MHKNIWLVILLAITLRASDNDLQITISDDNSVNNESFPLVSPQSNTLLKHLTINNAIGGGITLSKLTLLGFISVTGSNNYYLPGLAVLEGASMIQLIWQRYFLKRLEEHGTERNKKCVSNLMIANVYDIGFGAVSSLATGGLCYINPVVNSVFTNCVLLLPTSVAGYLWSNVYDYHNKYKKIKNSL